MTDPSKAAEDEEPRENEKLLSHENGSAKTDADGNGTQEAIIEKKVRVFPYMTSRSRGAGDQGFYDKGLFNKKRDDGRRRRA